MAGIAEIIVLGWWIGQSVLVIPAAILAIPPIGRRFTAWLVALYVSRFALAEQRAN